MTPADLTALIEKARNGGLLTNQRLCLDHAEAFRDLWVAAEKMQSMIGSCQRALEQSGMNEVIAKLEGKAWFDNDSVHAVIKKSDFLAALAERDAYVKAECVRVCRKMNEETPYYLSQVHEGIDKCAIAIEQTKLP